MKKKIFSHLISFSLIFTIILSMCIPVEASSWDESENNSWYRAKNWSINSSISGVLDGDCRYYKIDVRQRGKLQISFSHNRAEYGEWNILLEKEMWDGYDPEELGSVEVNASGRKTVVMPPLGVEPGEYYVCIWGSAEPSYTLTNSFTATDSYEIEDNGNEYRANTFPLNSTIKGNGFYGIDKDDDFYQIDVTEKGRLEFEFSHDVGTDDKFYFYIEKDMLDGETETILGGNILASDKKAVHPSVGVDPGIYYVHISFDDDIKQLEYKLSNRFVKDKKYESEINDTFYCADKIELNSYIKGEITNLEYESLSSLFAYGYDCFEVKNSKGKNISIRFSHDKSKNGKWTVQIYEKVNGEYKSLTEKTVEASGGTAYFTSIKSNRSNLFVKVTTSRSRFGGSESASFTKYKISASQYVKKPTGLTAKSTSSSVTLSWNQVSGTKGYEIQKYSAGKWSTVKTISGTSSKTTIKGLKSGKNYKFRVKAFKTFDGRKAYSAASKTITVKTR